MVYFLLDMLSVMIHWGAVQEADLQMEAMGFWNHIIAVVRSKVLLARLPVFQSSRAQEAGRAPLKSADVDKALDDVGDDKAGSTSRVARPWLLLRLCDFPLGFRRWHFQMQFSVVGKLIEGSKQGNNIEQDMQEGNEASKKHRKTNNF